MLFINYKYYFIDIASTIVLVIVFAIAMELIYTLARFIYSKIPNKIESKNRIINISKEQFVYNVYRYLLDIIPYDFDNKEEALKEKAENIYNFALEKYPTNKGSINIEYEVGNIRQYYITITKEGKQNKFFDKHEELASYLNLSKAQYHNLMNNKDEVLYNNQELKDKIEELFWFANDSFDRHIELFKIKNM